MIKSTYYFCLFIFFISLVSCSKEDTKDTDGDGIIDSLDLCPNTPSFERIGVDQNGCSVSQRDTDGDGVSDDVDDCTDTPSGSNVGPNGCEYNIDNGEGITLDFIDGLNDDNRFKLEKDGNGFYHLLLDEIGQTQWRLSARLTRDGEPGFYHPNNGYKHRLEWSSNLYWWLMEGDTVANITERYFNEFTGEYEYVNLPPLINFQDVLVPTINEVGMTDEDTGIGNTVIGPIREMKGDTMLVTVTYRFITYRKEEGSSFYEPLDEERIITDQVRIVLD